MNRELRNIVVPVMALLLSSCTVFEDREVCPCWLSFVLNDCHDIADGVHVSASVEDLLFDDEILLSDYPSFYEKEVVRTLIHTCVYSLADVSRLDQQHVLMIPEGHQADELFVHINTVDCNREFAQDTVILHKQWSCINVKIVADDDDVSLYTIVIRSNIQGVDLFDLSPVYGSYIYSPCKGEDGTFSFRVLRHAEEEAVLFMYIYRNGVLIDEVDVNHSLESVQYDWNEMSLADIDMGINLTLRNTTITVVPWEDKGNEDIII